MKKILLFIAVVLLAVGCGENEQGSFSNKLYVSIANAAYNQIIPVDADDNRTGTLSKEITLAMSKLEKDKDVIATMKVAPGAMDFYRKYYNDPSAELLPESFYSLSDSELIIESGTVETTHTAKVNFTRLNALADIGTHNYVLPVTIADANINVLDRANTVYYIATKASLVNMVAGLGKNMRLYPGSRELGYGNPAPLNNLTQFTMEALVRINNFLGPEVTTIMGIEERMMIRIGDASPYPRNYLQVSYSNIQNWLINPHYPTGPAEVDNASGSGNEGRNITKFPNPGTATTIPALTMPQNVWTHVALTFDKGEITLFVNGIPVINHDGRADNVKSISFAEERFEGVFQDGVKIPQPNTGDAYVMARYFFVGYAYDNKRNMGGDVAEIRIWNKPLTTAELQADGHFYKVPVDSPGLVAYWRCNDGEGNIVRDHTVNGNHMIADSTDYDTTDKTQVNWIPVTLPE